ncbi:hypothetical protein OG689_00350 [Kitasatospora sp. NBC_00240]|uniref:WXG100-like domain-containing protein n=1 Tax=Kitasatospora sp. NBC_00240 TaxID=2903567 RepID=UPI00225356DF|nr:hypothetical protein [Kitasatospora sp. NBC_00240]MCX5207783.1 hypothetical protein [Kitasatospora sp. NBC_00240]
MIELPSDLAEVLKVVQSNEHGSAIVFPNANEELLAELAAAWEAWNTAAEPAVRTIVASANRAMANMSGSAADSFESYLRKYAGTDQSHAVTTLDAGVAMAQSLRGAEQAVTQTKGEMVRELRYAKDYMDQNPAGKHDDIAQSEGIKTAADTYNRYVGQVGTSVDSMLRESAGHIERMTGAGQVATLGGHGEGATSPTRVTPSGAAFDPTTLQRPDGVDLASYPGAVPPGGPAAEFSPFSATDGVPGGMPGTLPDGMGGVGGSGGSSYRPQLASFKPFEPPTPGSLGGGASGGSSGGIGMGGADLPVYRPNPTSLSLAGLSGSQSSFDPTGGIGGSLSPWSGTGRGGAGSGPGLAGGSFGGAFGGASPFGGLGLPGGLGAGAARPSAGGSRFTPGSTTAASAGRGVTGTSGRSLAGGMPGAGGTGRGASGGSAGGFGGGRGVGSGSVSGARAGGARSGLGVAGGGEGSARSGLGTGTGSGRGAAAGAAGAGAGTGRAGASAAGAGGAHAGGHPGGGGGGGRRGKGEGNRFVRPSRFGEGGPEDEEGSELTDSGVHGQAVRHEQGDRRMEQMRRRWLDAARSDDQVAPQSTGPQGSGAQGAGRPGPDGADGADAASSEQALLTQLASAVLGTPAPGAEAPETGAASDEPAATQLASATPAAAAAAPAAPQGAADTAATGDDAYLDRARAAAARRGRPDEAAPAGRGSEAGAPASAASAAEAGRPAPLREEGGFQVPSPFLRAALSRLAATGSLEGADAGRPAAAAGR